MVLNDPNGYDWPGYSMTSMSPEQWAENALQHDETLPEWKRNGYSSYEAWIDAMSGACPPDDWPMDNPPPYRADDEGRITPDDSAPSRRWVYRYWPRDRDI